MKIAIWLTHIKAVFHQANFIARSDFFFCLQGHSTGTKEKPIEFTQRNFDSCDKIHIVENSLYTVVPAHENQAFYSILDGILPARD